MNVDWNSTVLSTKTAEQVHSSPRDGCRNLSAGGHLFPKVVLVNWFNFVKWKHIIKKISKSLAGRFYRAKENLAKCQNSENGV